MKKSTLHKVLLVIGALMLFTSYVNLSDLTVPAAIACVIFIAVLFVYTQYRAKYVQEKKAKAETVK